MPDTAQIDEMDEIIQDFIVETDELLQGLDQQLIEMEKAPEDKELLNSIFRSFHTTKGAAGFLGFNQIVTVAHSAEDILNKLRQATLEVTTPIMDALLEALDMLKLLLFHVKEKDGKEEDLSGVIGSLNVINDGKEGVAAATPKKDAKPAQKQSSGQEPSAQQSGSKTKKEDTETIRVDIKRLDDVLNMVGELVLGRNRLMKLCSQLEDRYGEDTLVSHLRQNTSHIDVITTDLQLSVMRTRMQPISRVFGKFPRMVRDLAKAKAKEVELVLKGEETELDKTVIEEIGDPLVHLVRNSIDHGIETPDERKKAGKPSKGILTLSAYHKGNDIFISIEDDGKGMDIDRIKGKAVEKSIATKEEVERLTERELLKFIFHPGFSTAKKVTDVSGRGVGMDVVKTNITKLNGSIDIESSPNKGSKVVLRLPLTLAIIQALVVRVGTDSRSESGDSQACLGFTTMFKIADDAYIVTVDGNKPISLEGQTRRLAEAN